MKKIALKIKLSYFPIGTHIEYNFPPRKFQIFYFFNRKPEPWKFFYVFTRSTICLQMPLPFDVILVNFSSIVLFSMLLQTCNNSFYCFCLFVYYFGPEVAKSIKIGFYMKGLSMWCPKMIKNHVLGISLLMVSLDFWSEKFDPP